MPQSLKTALDICLTSRSPILLWWGPELVELYNDAYRPVLGATKHPRALGVPGREIWPEIWHIIGPQLDAVITEGVSTWSDTQLILLDRYGYEEETYFTWGYSPIRDESGSIGGVFSSVLEQTERVLSERRFRTLRELAAPGASAKTRDEACLQAADVLSRNGADVPFALLYLRDGNDGSIRLAGHTGLAPGYAASPPTVHLTDSTSDVSPWPFSRAVASGRPEVVTDLTRRFPELSDGPWPVTPHTALVVPLMQFGHNEPRNSVSGFLVAAVSARRMLDDSYRGFYDLAAGHIAASIANA